MAIKIWTCDFVKYEVKELEVDEIKKGHALKKRKEGPLTETNKNICYYNFSLTREDAYSKVLASLEQEMDRRRCGIQKLQSFKEKLNSET